MHAQLTLPTGTFQPLASSLLANDAPRVLIVEDDPALRDLLCRTLAEEYPDACVQSASTSQQALALAAQTRPRLLLLDYHLWGSALNGIELYDAFCDQGESISTIMISGDAPLADLQLRHIPSLGKPFDFETLLERVGRELSLAQAVGVSLPAD